MASNAEEALAKAKQLASQAHSQSTSEVRRTFYEHLISICAYPSYDCKAFFGTLVAKHFREFEDLQDKAIDAILDLCEDDEERIRIIGIKGLGATAKADSRWVRGNVGVLLQLLECPPRELRLIHEQLYILLSISPSDVFAVMLDDMRANEDMGPSRKNIIAFLTRDALLRLEKLFESGDNSDAEDTLQKGLEDLLPSLEPLDQSSVLVLLGSLPKISSRTASEGSTRSFVKLLTRSIKHGSTSDKTAPYVHAMEAYIRRNPPLRPLDGLIFAGDHGQALVRLSLEKREDDAVRVVEKTMEWVEKGTRDLGTKDAKELAGDIVDGYLRGLKYYTQDNGHKTYFSTGQGKAVEMLLYTLYQLFLVKDDRRDMIGKAHRTALLDLEDEARKLAKTAEGASRRELESINELVRVLENDRKSLPRGLVPSWKAQRRPSPPRSSASTVKKEASMSTLRSSSPPRSQPTPWAEAPQTKSDAPMLQPKVEPIPVAPVASSSRAAQQAAPLKLTTVAPPPLPVSTGPAPGSTPSMQPIAQAPHTSITSAHPTPAAAVAALFPSKAPSRSRSLAQRISSGPPPFIDNPRASYSGTELLPGPPVSSDPNETAAKDPAVELLPFLGPSSTTPNDVPMAEHVSPPPNKSSTSLLERMGMGTGKRQRDEPQPSTPHRSLIDRMSGPSTDTRTPKRPREDAQLSSAPVNGSRSLLSRMSSNDTGSPAPLPTKPSMSIRQTPPTTTTINKPLDASSSSAQSSISILHRASRPTTSTPIKASAPPTAPPSKSFESTELLPSTSSSAPVQSMNIRARASQPPTSATSAPPAPVRPVLSIRSSSGGDDDMGVRRKGRGFEKKDTDGDSIIFDPRPEPQTNGHGQRGLAERLGVPPFGR